VINSLMDKFISQGIHIRNTPWPAYQVLGYIGIVLSIFLSLAFVIYLDMSILVLAGITLVSVLTFICLAMLTKILTGRESLIYYHHEIAITLTTAGLLKVLHQPVLPYLDITILGIGTFLFCGRIGCFMVGCCHGRPHHWGVCYSDEHRKAGFTPYFVGVKLFPVQLLESLFVLLVVITGTTIVLSKSYIPGEVLAWYVIAYGAARFFFEFLRGDPDRLYFLTFSEAQWTSLILMSFIVLAEMSGILNLHLWHIVTTACIMLTMVIVFIVRRYKPDDYKLLHPDHIKEIAEAIERINEGLKGDIFPRENTPANICLSQTTLGIMISAGKIEDSKGRIYHYALSGKNCFMNEERAKTLMDLILKLRHFSHTSEIVKGDKGVFHLLVQTPLCVPPYQGGD
jgi:prolipoprotein diacylglyceryltransferase